MSTIQKIYNFLKKNVITLLKKANRNDDAREDDSLLGDQKLFFRNDKESSRNTSKHHMSCAKSNSNATLSSSSTKLSTTCAKIDSRGLERNQENDIIPPPKVQYNRVINTGVRPSRRIAQAYEAKNGQNDKLFLPQRRHSIIKHNPSVVDMKKCIYSGTEVDVE